MTTREVRVWLLLLAVLWLLSLAFPRFEWHPVGNTVFRIDRWSGTAAVGRADAPWFIVPTGAAGEPGGSRGRDVLLVVFGAAIGGVVAWVIIKARSR